MNTNTHLTVFGAVGLCEALNGSLLTLSGLTDGTQLTLHLGQLLLQLLHTETNRIKVTTCGFIKRIQTVNGALVGHTMLLASLSWILACRDWTWSWAFCSSLTH